MGKVRTIRDRLFAWMGVIIVVLSAGALSAFVIVQAVTSPSSSNSQANTVSQAVNQNSCADTSTTEPTLAAPAVYTPSGAVTSLQVTDLSIGNGATAKSGDCLVMKYYGTLATDGTLFDENFSKPSAFAFVLGQGQVIPGWDQGLVGMKVGGIRRLVIPATMAYGSAGSCKVPAPGNSSQCRTYAIPPNTPIVFVVKLLRIQ